MDELEISGRRYISSARAAKEHKYHSDYIGQLVRGGKVAGQKVGRAWYIDADSLSEYLGKEVPARGPMVKKPEMEKTVEELTTKSEAEESFERSVAEPEVKGLSEDSHQEPEVKTEPEPEFVLPFKKSAGRHHTIAAIESKTPVKNKVAKVEYKEPEKKVEPIEEPVGLAVRDPYPVDSREQKFVEEFNAQGSAEEETYIPLKIKKEIQEPEDSFYKISPRSLRYVTKAEPAAPRDFEEAALPASAPRSARAPKNFGVSLVKATGVLVAAGALSLCAGVVASYYLHSITTIGNTGQTSDIILSQ